MCLTCGCMDAHLEMGSANIRYEDVMAAPLGDQVVVITGASQGIGRETALEMASRGASLVVAARNEEALTELARQVVRIGGHAEPVVTDVADYAQVERL